MGLFQNDFFSAAGQKERLANVGNTLLAAVGLKKGGVVSNTGIKAADVVLGAAASHPFLTAGAGAVVTNPSGAAAVVKKAVSVAGAEFSKLSLGGKAVTVVSTPIVASAVISSPKLQKSIANAPSSLVSFGANLGAVAENPNLETVGNLVKENPALTVGLAGAGLLVGGSAVRGVANIVATAQNTAAIKKNTQAGSVLENSDTVLYPLSVAGKSNLVAPVTDSAVKTPILPVRQGKTTRKKNKKQARLGNITQSVRVNITDDRDITDRKVFKQQRR